ncbi:hypothetical protein YQE_00393, partial [Dendroctonus ponderosae]
MDIEASFDMFEDELDILEIIEFGFPKRIYIRNNPLEDLDELTFFKRFRLYKTTVIELMRVLQPDLEYPNELNNSVSPVNQFLTCLRVYATGGHLSSVADFTQMDTSTVSRIVQKVSMCLVRLAPRYIKMPVAHEFRRKQTKFYNIARLPRVLGVVDGTQIRIQSPGGEDAEIFRNRKSYFSINTQVICDADLKFINLVASWPGSSHDSTIFNNSNVCTRFERGEFANGILLGDSGYPLKNFLLTPLRNPNNREQNLYNEALIRTRVTIERAIGVWKRRFPILAYGSRLKVETTLYIITATAVLHNIAREMNEPEPPQGDEISINELDYLIDIGQLQDVNINNISNNTQQQF